MADDYTLASRVNIPPPINPLETVQGVERYRLLRDERQQKDIDLQKLSDWGKSGNSRDLLGATPELRTSALAGDTQDMEIKKDTMARDAHYIMNEKDPAIRKYLWDKKGEEYVGKGWVPKEVWDKHKGTPNDEVLGNIIRGSISVPKYRETTGEQAGAVSAAGAPYQFHSTNPQERSGYPAVGPGGPLENGSPVGRIGPAGATNPAFGASGGPPMGAPSNTGPRPPGTVNLTDTNATVVPPTGQQPGTPGVSGTPSAAPGKNIPAVDKTNPYATEVPSVQVGHDYPTGKGVVQPGVDPIRAAARVEGQKKYMTEIEPEATAAAKTRSSLGTMKAELDKGVTTDRLTEVKTSIAGFLYAALGNDKNAIPEVRKMTGLDLGNQEVFNKESTRMGLTFARQTEGAREAVQAIRIALGANPSLMNSREGNRTIIGIMDQSAKYDQERAKAAQAWMQKNDGHLQGFDQWWSTNHSPATFISKAVPYEVPSNVNEFQNGVTYRFSLKGPDGEPLKNKSGKVEYKTGTWNAETHHMDGVE